MTHTNKKTKIIELTMIGVILVGILIFIIIDYQNLLDKFKLVFIEKKWYFTYFKRTFKYLYDFN